MLIPARRPGLVIGVFCFVLSVHLVAAAGEEPVAPRQDSSSPLPVFAPRTSVPEAISFFAPFVIPKFLQDLHRFRNYVRGEEFAQFRRLYGDLHAVDALFDQAMRLCWNNPYEALLLCLLVTLEHRRLTISLPLVGGLISLPLAPDFEEDFVTRICALPSKLYADSPTGRAGDRDKLQHFFGSAFLALLTESRSAAENTGVALELLERRFVRDRGPDERDIRSNRQGQQFGIALIHDRSCMPSGFLTRIVKEEE